MGNICRYEKLPGPASIDKSFEHSLCVQRDDETEYLPVRNIDWIEACDNYVIVHCAGENHILNDTMLRLESVLDSKQFQRIHRSIIVNLLRIKKLRMTSPRESIVVLEDGTTLQISRRRKAEVKQALLDREE